MATKNKRADLKDLFKVAAALAAVGVAGLVVIRATRPKKPTAARTR